MPVNPSIANPSRKALHATRCLFDQHSFSTFSYSLSSLATQSFNSGSARWALNLPISRSMTEYEPKFESPWPESRQCHQPQGWLDPVTEPTWHNQSLMELPIHGVLVYLDRSLPECAGQRRRFLGAGAA